MHGKRRSRRGKPTRLHCYSQCFRQCSCKRSGCLRKCRMSSAPRCSRHRSSLRLCNATTSGSCAGCSTMLCARLAGNERDAAASGLSIARDDAIAAAMSRTISRACAQVGWNLPHNQPKPQPLQRHPSFGRKIPVCAGLFATLRAACDNAARNARGGGLTCRAWRSRFRATCIRTSASASPRARPLRPARLRAPAPSCRARIHRAG